MATYKEIRGVNIQSRDSDPTAVEGDVWYNASTSKIRMYQSTGAWATGNVVPANGDEYAKGTGAGTQTAAIFFGGLDDDGVADESFTYDGTNYTDIGAMTNNRQMLGGCGTSTAALGASGYTVGDHGADTEEWDGSSWTETANLGTAAYGRACAGTQTAGLAISGNTYPGPETADTELYLSLIHI